MNINELLELHSKTCAHAIQTMKKKNHDYTNGSDSPFSNFEMTAFLGIDPRFGLLIRVLDKIKRMDTFISKATLEVTSESFDDAIEDVINYMVLLKGLNIHMTEPRTSMSSKGDAPCYYCTTSTDDNDLCTEHKGLLN